jgi:hypothetical protein
LSTVINQRKQEQITPRLLTALSDSVQSRSEVAVSQVTHSAVLPSILISINGYSLS